jgi:SAM-dependent methyltransferase
MNEEMRDEFWESVFSERQEMWGFEPAESALTTKERFLKNNVKNVLIPGIGYGRNARVFSDAGMNVTGIEISKTAVELAEKHFGKDLKIFHGSVTEMPFDQNQYNGIFCYALIHLLDSSNRKKLIADCYNQLTTDGLMVFVVITKEAHTYGQGKRISKDRYEIFEGVQMYFYDKEAVHAEFGAYGLVEISEITESFPFFMIVCRKPA